MLYVDEDYRSLLSYSPFSSHRSGAYVQLLYPESYINSSSHYLQARAMRTREVRDAYILTTKF